MRYSTQQDVLDFVEDNNVKFVRFAFCDIFGTQKNIAVLASDLPKALEDGVCFDGSSIAGFMKVEESDLVLRPDLPTVTILPCLYNYFLLISVIIFFSHSDIAALLLWL